MLLPSGQLKVYLALGRTDMRKSINGLSMLVEDHLDLDPFSGHLFVFCNRRCHILKILYWDLNGFCLFLRRAISPRESLTFNVFLCKHFIGQDFRSE